MYIHKAWPALVVTDAHATGRGTISIGSCAAPIAAFEEFSLRLDGFAIPAFWFHGRSYYIFHQQPTTNNQQEFL
jgi:hypothetical protein